MAAAPEAAELSLALCFHEPMVEFAATTSGGDSRQQGEFHFGVGAFYNDLASRGGEFRFRLENNALEGVGTKCFGIPLASVRRYPSVALLPGNSCLLDVGLQDPLLTLFLELGQFKHPPGSATGKTMRARSISATSTSRGYPAAPAPLSRTPDTSPSGTTPKFS